MPIHITIDQLVLHGVERRDRDAIADAIRDAIAEHVDVARLKARAADLGGADRLTAPDAVAPRGVRGSDLGAGVGRSIAHAINGRSR